MRKLAAVLGFLLLSVHPASARTSGMDHVNASNHLRCGYITYEPALTKDLKTGAWRGFDYDIVRAIANRLELQADYTAETGWATVVADLNAGKFDMLCNTFWVHPNVAKFALFSRPAFFQPVFVVARAGDNRFASGVIPDDAKLKMASLEGDNPVAIAKADFPRVQILTLPNMTDPSQVMLSVADGRADFTIEDAVTFHQYDKNNPGKMKIVTPAKPIRIYPSGFVFRAEDGQLRDAVNIALDELILDGTIDRIMNKYDHYPLSYYRAEVNYRDPYRAH